MFIIPILFIILVVWLFVHVLRPPYSNNGVYPHYTNFNNTQSARPMEILKERYAKGEISEDEYLKIKRNLEA